MSVLNLILMSLFILSLTLLLSLFSLLLTLLLWVLLRLRHLDYITIGVFCTGKIWGLSQNKNGAYQSTLLIDSQLMISSFAQGNDGEIYVLHYGGKVYKLVKS